MYDNTLNKGIRKKYKYLSDSNPTKVELSKSTTYYELLEVAKSLYFKEFDSSDSLYLADSTGMLINVLDPNMWSLGSFYLNNALQPSRYINSML